jgi:hypothetical protein
VYQIVEGWWSTIVNGIYIGYAHANKHTTHAHSHRPISGERLMVHLLLLLPAWSVAGVMHHFHHHHHAAVWREPDETVTR